MSSRSPPIVPQALTLGSTVNSDIAVTGETDVYTFTLASMSNLYFDSLSDNNNLQWTLNGPAGTAVNQRSFTDSDWFASQQELRNLPAGDYQLTIDGSGDTTGSYSFRLLDLAAASPLTPGTPVSATLSPLNETDAYLFIAAAGDRFFFDVQDSTDMGNAAWRLLDPYGNELFSPYFNDVDNVTLNVAGSYTLLIEGYPYDTGTGSYTFNVEFQDNTPPILPTGTALTLGTLVSESLDVTGESDVYTFTLASVSNLYFDTFSDDSSFNWTLVGPGGTATNQRSFTDSDWFTSLQQLRNLPAGDYALTVANSFDATGNYSFRLSNLADASSMIPGTPVSDNLSPLRETDAYGFAAAAGDRFFFDVQDSTDMGSAAWRLLDPFGNEVFNQGFSDLDTLTLAAAGDYTLLVEGAYFDTGTGSYTINVQPITPATPSALTLGSTRNEDIGVTGETDVYTFTLATVSNLYFDSLSDDGNVNWTLTGPAGTTVNQRSFINSDWFASLQELQDLPAGGYTLTIDGFGDTTGSYSFRLLDLAAASPLTPGTPVSDTLSPLKETDAYRFPAAAGDQFFFDVQDSTDTGSAGWRLLDAFGNEIFNQGFSDVDTVTLDVASDYVLLVEGSYFDTGTGSYTINVQPITPAALQTLTLGSTVNETIAVAGETDVHAFTLATASNLYFDSFSDDGNFNWTLTGPAGTAVNQRSFNHSDQFASLRDLRLPAGDYTVTVDGFGDSVGSYSFRLLDLAAATLITTNTRVVEGLTPPSETDLYRFDATAGERFFFDRMTLGSGLFNTSWRLLDPFGNEVFNQGFSDVDTLTVPVTGTYTLMVEGSSFNTTSSAPIVTGSFGAMAGSLDDNESTALEVELNVPGGNISFDRYVSSEGGFNFLTFYIDGVFQDAWSGDVPTSNVSFAVSAGVRTFRWEYSKDGSVAAGDDTAWIDNLSFPGGATEGFESGGFSNLPWVVSGDADWGVQAAPPPNPYSFTVYQVADRASVPLPLATATGQTFSYDSTFNQLTSSTDELGRQTFFAINPANGNTTSFTQVVGAVGGNDDLVTQFTYTAQGLIDTVTDPLGRVADNDYDTLGRLTSITFAKGTSDEATRRFEYDATGNTTAVIDENGNRTEFAYDTMNRIVRITESDPDDAGPLTAPVTQLSYDARGNLVSTTDANQTNTRNRYDVRDRLTRTIDANNQESTFAYDRAGNLIAVIDPLGRRTVNRFDARNRLIETVDPDGGSTKFGYDADDNLLAVTDPVNNTTQFGYDARNRLRQETDPIGNATQYQYDLADNLLTKTDRNDRVTEFVYNDLDRLVTETWVGGGNAIEYTYDGAGNLTSVIDAFGALEFTYDARDRVTTVDNAGTPGAPNVVLAYAYDDVGNVLSVTDVIAGTAGATTSYAYDALNRTTRLTQAGTGLADKRVDLAYNPLGQFAGIRSLLGLEWHATGCGN